MFDISVFQTVNSGWVFSLLLEQFRGCLNKFKLNQVKKNANGNSLNHFTVIGLVGRVFANGPGDRGLIPGRVIPMTLKMVLDTSLLNIQQYKVRIKGKVKQSRERSSALPYTSV